MLSHATGSPIIPVDKHFRPQWAPTHQCNRQTGFVIGQVGDGQRENQRHAVREHRIAHRVQGVHNLHNDRF